MNHAELLAIKKRAEVAITEHDLTTTIDLSEAETFIRKDVPALVAELEEKMKMLKNMVHCAVNDCYSCAHKREDESVCNDKFRAACAAVEAWEKGKP